MPDFETILRFLVLAGGSILILVGTAFALKGLRAKPSLGSDAADRLRELEARLGELEERVDFTERALTEFRARAQIPKQ